MADLGKRARETPSFIESLTTVIREGLMKGPGGVSVPDAAGKIIGAVGTSGISMTNITLSQAQTIVTGALEYARAQKLMPLLVLVLDARAAPKACSAEDGTSNGRYDVAHGKADGALAIGMGSRTLAKRARDTPSFIASLATVVRGGLVAGPGGVLVRDAAGEIIGAVGISGDVGDNDEAAALAGIAAAGLVGDPGKDLRRGLFFAIAGRPAGFAHGGHHTSRIVDGRYLTKER